MAKKTETSLEAEKLKEAAREVALKNLKAEKLMNLASAYLVENGSYGEDGGSAVDQFIYQPALAGGTTFYDPATGKETSIIIDPLLQSRSDGKRYTGSVRELDIIKKAAAIQTESLVGIKVSDALEIMGVNYDGEYKDKYLRELYQGTDKEKEFFGQIFGTYQKNSADTSVSDALGQRVKFRKSGLEETLKAPKPTDSE
jgi:hypothetical protein